VRRTTSRSAGHLEPFTLTDVLLAVGRELDVVSQALTIEPFRALRENLPLTMYAYYLAEVVDQLTEEREENRAVFDVLVQSLQQLAAPGGDADQRLVLVGFLIELLDVLGYRPELRVCTSCRATIEPGPNQFSPLAGGVLCPSCGPREASARPVSVPGLKLLRYVQQTGGQRRVAAPMAVMREAEGLLRNYAEHLIERRLRSPALIARVVDLQTYNTTA
jgi:DNA repair protein RecO (recombination protein O)